MILNTFTFPVGIRLFNRPDYAEQLLSSLSHQTMTLDGSLVYCIIDSYIGSKSEKNDQPDNTQEVEHLVKKHFPKATVIKPESNIGLAKALHLLQTTLFETTQTDWALFFEDDLVLEPEYLEQINHLIHLSNGIPEITKVGVFQLRTGYIKHPPTKNRKDFFLGEGTKAFAERRSYFELRKQLTEVYLSALGDVQYSQRDHVRIYTAMALHGVFAITTYNDAIHDRLAAYFKKLHVVTAISFARDIGSEGENNLRHPKVALNHTTSKELLQYRESDLSDLLPNLKQEQEVLERALFNDFYRQFMSVSRGRYALQFVITRGLEKILAVIKNIFRR